MAVPVRRVRLPTSFHGREVTLMVILQTAGTIASVIALLLMVGERVWRVWRAKRRHDANKRPQ
jgi:uncharacterized membrane protein